MSTNESVALLARLEILLRLTAIGLCAARPQRESIDLLAKAGFAPREIAGLLDTTSNTVSVTISALRRERRSPNVRRARQKRKA